MADLTMTAGELITHAPMLGRISTREFENPKASYAITKCIRKAHPELQELEAQRLALCERHAQKDESGGPVKQTDDTTGREVYVFVDPEAFAKDWSAITSEPVTLSGCRAITVDETQGARFTPEEFALLGPFVADE